MVNHKSEKLALIVDDSRMARVVLGKMLNEQNIDVVQVESGEEALGYLAQNTPDMIFMDHTMPGMDGFQALRAIRNDPRHASIPIMMYTSKEGEVYVSQARALGAAAVIPKKRLKAEQLVSILEGQNLLPASTERSARSAADTRVPAEDTADLEFGQDPLGVSEDNLVEVTKEVEARLGERAELSPMRRMMSDFREQMSADRHRDVDGLMTRLEEKLLHIDARLDEMQVGQQLSDSRQSWSNSRVMVLFSLILAGVALLLGIALWSKDTQYKAREHQVAQQEESFSRREASAEARVSALEQELKTLTFDHQKSSGQLYELLASTLSSQTAFGWNEPPFNDRIAERLEALAAELDALGFRGIITLRSHIGRFCLKAKGNGEPVMPDAKSAVTACEISRPSESDAEEQGLRQSNAFANTLSAVEARFGNHLQVVVETAGAEDELQKYPESFDGITAGEWNAIAASNQRIEFTFTPL